MKKLTKKELEAKYKTIENYYDKYLKDLGIKLPHLIWRGKYTEKALTLICLSENYPKTRAVSKSDLTKFIKQYNKSISDDIQAGRHLGKQDGWYIVTGRRGDLDEGAILDGSYKLISLEKGYPKFSPDRRGDTITDDFWENLKKTYGYRCAFCGSKENEPHRYNPEIKKTQLQKGHKNPNKPLSTVNIIPQCENCNRPDLNKWEYNDEGRVIGIANASVIKQCSKEIKKEIYSILYKQFSGKNPNDI